jgi:hypothetical protein
MIFFSVYAPSKNRLTASKVGVFDFIENLSRQANDRQELISLCKAEPQSATLAQQHKNGPNTGDSGTACYCLTILGGGGQPRGPSIFGDPVRIGFDPAQGEEMHLLDAKVRMALLMCGKLSQ